MKLRNLDVLSDKLFAHLHGEEARGYNSMFFKLRLRWSVDSRILDPQRLVNDHMVLNFRKLQLNVR